MKLHSLSFRTSLLLSVVALLGAAPRVDAQGQAASQPSFAQASAVQTPAVPARITQASEAPQAIPLKGTVLPLARPEFDRGAVEDSMPVTRALLLLQRSAEQEAQLSQLLEDQQNKASANFHEWLTPQQFGQQFGPADADIQSVTDWLTSHGFQVAKVSAGKTVIEFSGTAGQVRNAFHTEIHRYVV